MINNNENAGKACTEGENERMKSKEEIKATIIALEKQAL
jgi:hypothetical protein